MGFWTAVSGEPACEPSNDDVELGVSALGSVHPETKMNNTQTIELKKVVFMIRLGKTGKESTELLFLIVHQRLHQLS